MAGPRSKPLPDRDDYPPNNITEVHIPKTPAKTRIPEGKVLTRRRKKTLTSGLTQAFFGNLSPDAVGTTISQIAVPAIKDLLVEFITATVEQVLFGERRTAGRGRTNRFGSNGPSKISYGNFYQNVASGEPEREFRNVNLPDDEYLFESRGEAEDVVDALRESLEQYGQVTVADLYELVGFETSHIDTRWGWESLERASLKAYQGGTLLRMPRRMRLKN